ncbi:MAG TPA: S1/P1 nuclease [Tepidisphaeraceae bacterium]|jgi:hypothetical protein|nr:S1/P1 nuclease [Tepidisphaeraceae bacterium]
MLKRSLLLVMAGLFAGLVSAPAALAWNATGHMMVAKEAWDDMSPADRAKATEILKHLPHYDLLLSHMPKDYTDTDAFAFMEAATWPDNIRSESHPSHSEHHGNWHYIDYPVNPDNVPAESPIEHWDGHSDPANLLQAMEKCEKELTDPATAPDRRAIALCWVIHLTGDIHQPLHATSLFGKQFPKGDKGGNSFIIKNPNGANGSVGLHSLWDNMLGTSRSPFTIDKNIAALQKNPKYSRDAMKDQIAEKDVKTWAKESYDLAVSIVYDNAHLAGASKELMTRDSQPPALPNGYMEKAHAIADQRVMLAGHRLADKLQQDLSAA